MLNVKQGSCEYQCYCHWFDPTRNQTRVYSSRDRRSIPLGHLSCFYWSLRFTSVKSTDEEQKKVFTSSDVLYCSENIGDEQKKVFTTLHVLYSSENDIRAKKVFTLSDALHSSGGSEITGQDGVIFQGVFNSPPENLKFPTGGLPTGWQPGAKSDHWPLTSIRYFDWWLGLLINVGLSFVFCLFKHLSKTVLQWLKNENFKSFIIDTLGDRTRANCSSSHSHPCFFIIATLVGLPYVLLMEDMSSFLTKINLSSEDVKNAKMLFFGILEHRKHDKACLHENFGMFQLKLRLVDVKTLFFFSIDFRRKIADEKTFFCSSLDFGRKIEHLWT